MRVLNSQDAAARETYRAYLEAIAQKHGHDTQWIERYMSVEFGEGYHVEVSAREMAEA